MHESPKLSYLNFIQTQVITEFLSTEEVEDIKEMFNKMDTDNDGIVTIEELKGGLRDFGTQLAESEVQMLIEAVHIFFPSTSSCCFFIITDCLTEQLKSNLQ